MSEPRTEAGRWLLDHWGLANHPSGDAIQPEDAILAVEAEAARQALEDVAERVRALDEALQWLVDHSVPTHAQWCFIQGDDEPCICGVSAGYDTVLALLSTKEEGS